MTEKQTDGAMTLKDAIQIQKDYFDLPRPTFEDTRRYTEAMDLIIRAADDPRDMMELGGVYYEERRFDLALKYYEMAAERGYDGAYECLGYIWYYGRTGTPDYEKAFHCFQKAEQAGNIVAAYKLADMYKNGYYVEKDYGKYCGIIEELYPRIKNARYVEEPLPEIFTRLARIRTQQGKLGEAVHLYRQARSFLEQRIRHNPFFGNLNIMMWLIDDLYRLVDLDRDDFDLYDLYHLAKEPARVTFIYKGRQQTWETLPREDGTFAIRFNGDTFADRQDFFANACIDGLPLTRIYPALHGYELV